MVVLQKARENPQLKAPKSNISKRENDSRLSDKLLVQSKTGLDVTSRLCEALVGKEAWEALQRRNSSILISIHMQLSN